VCDIPALLRKCVGPDTVRKTAVWERCRVALGQFCDSHFRFPGIVRDPQFYCPPFRSTNPYVGSIPHDVHAPQTSLIYEGSFFSAPRGHVVHCAQLLILLLLNFKEERLHPTAGLRSTTPVRTPLRVLSTPKRKAAPVRTATPRHVDSVSDCKRLVVHQNSSANRRGNVSGKINVEENPEANTTGKFTGGSPHLTSCTSSPQESLQQSPRVIPLQVPKAMVDLSPTFNPFSSPSPNKNPSSTTTGAPRASDLKDSTSESLFASPSLIDHDSMLESQMSLVEQKLSGLLGPLRRTTSV
jgi:hypothetical protein